LLKALEEDQDPGPVLLARLAKREEKILSGPENPESRFLARVRGGMPSDKAFLYFLLEDWLTLSKGIGNMRRAAGGLNKRLREGKS
jgi:hypothetical protein